MAWMSDYIALPLKLAAARKAAGLTQDQMAAKLGVDARTIRRVESSETEIKTRYLFAWADACGLRVAMPKRTEVSGSKEDA